MVKFGTPEFNEAIARGEQQATEAGKDAVVDDPLDRLIDDRFTNIGGRVDREIIAERLGASVPQVPADAAREMLSRALRGEIPPHDTGDHADPENVERSRQRIPQIRKGLVEGALLRADKDLTEISPTIIDSMRARKVGQPIAEEALIAARRGERKDKS